MELVFHPSVAKDARSIGAKYRSISEELCQRFWDELEAGIDSIEQHSSSHHYDPSGMRRYNLKKFPYHILFEERLDCNRIMVIRHHNRNPGFGLRRK